LLDGPPEPGGQRTLALVTTGLASFVGREIEWLPATLPPAVIAQRVYGVCQYLIVNGMVLKDGDTVGVSESERIRVHFAERGQRGAPVLQLTMEVGPVAAGATPAPSRQSAGGAPARSTFGKRGLSR
jgi:hypothetical protein